MAMYPEVTQRYVKSWTVIGTPFQGAPKAMHALIGGYDFDNPLISPSDSVAFGTEVLL